MRKPFVRKVVIGVLAVVVLLGVGIAAFWPWSAFIILSLYEDRNGFWTSTTCHRTLRSTVTSMETGLEAKLFHIQCSPPLFVAFEEGTLWYDFFALTFVKPGTNPSRYVTAMRASFNNDNSRLASWRPEMVWKDSHRFHIALPSSIEVWIKEPSFAVWKDSGQLEIMIRKVATLEIERVPDKVATDTVQ